MRYETPEVFEVGAADELTLGAKGCCCDCECGLQCCCGGTGLEVRND